VRPGNGACFDSLAALATQQEGIPGGKKQVLILSHDPSLGAAKRRSG
jgi:hypothetical protein